MMLKQWLSLLTISFITLATQAATVTGDAKQIQFKQVPANAKFFVIHGPNGFYLKSKSAQVKDENSLKDGSYNYSILGIVESKKIVNRYKQSLNNGRSTDVKPNKYTTSEIESGYFYLLNGQLVKAADE